MLLSAESYHSQDLKRMIFEDALAVWDAYRDPDNGLWCDTLSFGNGETPITTCGEQNNFYSSAGIGNADI